VFASAIQGLTSALTALFIGRLVAAIVLTDGDRALAAVVTLLVTELVLTAASLAVLDLRFRLEESTGLLIEQELISRMTSAPTLELHERPEHLDRIEVLRKQKGMLSGSVGALLHNFSIVSTFVTLVGLLATVHPLLGLLPLGGAPALISSARWMTASQKIMDETAERRRRADHLFELGTTAGPSKELRTFGLASEIVARHGRLIRSAHADIDRVAIRWGLLTGIGWGALGLVRVAAVAYAALLAIDGRATLAEVLLVVSVAGQLDQHLSQLTEMVSWMFNTLRAAERYVDVMDAADELTIADVPWEPAPAPERLVRGIDLHDVSFRYPDTDDDVLHDITLTIPAGSIVSIVGENGAGKSTLVKLLARCYEPTEGVISVDGVDLRRIDVVEWRRRMSGAFQDHARFELVAHAVVGIGELQRMDDRAAIELALARAGGAELADRLDHGLDTPLGRSFDDGVEPSGGQWQQLALGRALLRHRPLLLLLDEPTAALDPDAEHALFEGYASAAREAGGDTGAITVLVSHRFSTVRMADLIVVMSSGRVTETGSHDELMAVGGTYAELFTLQATAYR
jgi:ATP-binding cassette subfamily B protein